MRIGLCVRMGSLESRKLLQSLFDAQNGSKTGKVHVEATRVVKLWHKGHVGERDLITHAVLPSGLLCKLFVCLKMGWQTSVISVDRATGRDNYKKMVVPCSPRVMNLRAQSFLRSSPTSLRTDRFCTGCVSAQIIITSCLTCARGTASLGSKGRSGLVSYTTHQTCPCASVSFKRTAIFL